MQLLYGFPNKSIVNMLSMPLPFWNYSYVSKGNVVARTPLMQNARCTPSRPDDRIGGKNLRPGPAGWPATQNKRGPCRAYPLLLENVRTFPAEIYVVTLKFTNRE